MAMHILALVWLVVEVCMFGVALCCKKCRVNCGMWVGLIIVAAIASKLLNLNYFFYSDLFFSSQIKSTENLSVRSVWSLSQAFSIMDSSLEKISFTDSKRCTIEIIYFFPFIMVLVFDYEPTNWLSRINLVDMPNNRRR